MEYFEINYYMEQHIDLEHKYFDLLQYCETYLCDRNDNNITPSQSNMTNNNSSHSDKDNQNQPPNNSNNINVNINNNKSKPVLNNNNNNNMRMETLAREDDKEDNNDKMIDQASIKYIKCKYNNGCKC